MPTSLNIVVERKGPIAILKTDGPVIDIEAEKIAETGQELIAEGIQNLVLNLENSHIVNSRGIAVLIYLIEQLRKQNSRMAFCGLTPLLTRTFRIMGLFKLADVYETEQDAVAALTEQAG